METPTQSDDFHRVLKELHQLVDEAARLERALDEVRADELSPDVPLERRHNERRQVADRRGLERRQA
jgi:hypothetical protein